MGVGSAVVAASNAYLVVADHNRRTTGGGVAPEPYKIKFKK